MFYLKFPESKDEVAGKEERLHSRTRIREGIPSTDVTQAGRKLKTAFIKSQLSLFVQMTLNCLSP